MSTITRETNVQSTPEHLWDRLIADPNRWTDWLTPLRGIEEQVRPPVREGLTLRVRLGKMGGKLQVTEVANGRRMRWAAGPPMMMAMGMGMRGFLRFDPGGDNRTTRVVLEMKSPMGPMGAMMMKMMAGLSTKDEMTKTITKVKQLGES